MIVLNVTIAVILATVSVTRKFIINYYYSDAYDVCYWAGVSTHHQVPADPTDPGSPHFVKVCASAPVWEAPCQLFALTRSSKRLQQVLMFCCESAHI